MPDEGYNMCSLLCFDLCIFLHFRSVRFQLVCRGNNGEEITSAAVHLRHQRIRQPCQRSVSLRSRAHRRIMLANRAQKTSLYIKNFYTLPLISRKFAWTLLPSSVNAIKRSTKDYIILNIITITGQVSL